jgi:hypothetical protein
MDTKAPRDRLGVTEYVIAEELGISVHTLRKDRIKHRRLPFFKIGSAVRYNLDRVREALAALEIGGQKLKARRGAR